MPRQDEAHSLTEKELKALEHRISQVYKQATDEVSATIKAYFESFRKRDEEMRKQVDAGEITEDYYKQWRLAQIGRGKRFEAMRDQLAERYTKANETAIAYVNDLTPGIYSLNRNYAAYTIEQVAGDVGFTIWDEQTAKRLIVEQPDVMPYYPPKRAVKRKIDLAYGKSQITKSVTSSILQGSSIGKMADDLQRRITDMSRVSAIRAARTSTTAAQNAGRLDSYHAAQNMGIKMRKEWLATLDGRTRHAHAMLDGQKADVDKPFKVEGHEIRYPGDPQAAPYLVYNCRCTLIAAVDDVDTSSAKRRAIDPKTGKSVVIDDTSYSEWAGWKQEVKSSNGSGIQTMEESASSEQLDLARRVWGKADGQKYRVSASNAVDLYETGRQRQSDGTWVPVRNSLGAYEVPENTDANKCVVTGLPNKTGFMMYDDTPNYILNSGRIALNSNAKNNNTRDQISGLVSNEIDILGGIRKDGHYYRVIGSEKEIEYIKNGTIRKSVNHMTGETEDGLSVWETPKYQTGKIVEVTGTAISTGSDGEPILDVSTVKFVRTVTDLVTLREQGKKRFMDLYGWTEKQLEQALRGGYELHR